MKWYFKILIIIFLCLLSFFLGAYNPFSLKPVVSEEPLTKGEYIGIFINILVAITSVLAIVVALFKESILKVLNHPQLEVQLLEDGIVENIDREQQNPKTESYQCLLEVNNKGNIVAESTEIVVEEVKFSKRSFTELQSLRGLRGKKKLYWNPSNVDLPPYIPKEIELFNIACPNNYGTPNVPSSESIDKLKIKFNGLDLKLRESKKGFWQIKYYINFKNGSSVRFILKVEWDGTWKNRKTEMKDVLKVNLEKL